jgi:uncharacterized membrane protein YtjA (UPF0391 family)
MLRWAAAFATIAITAIVLGLFEPAFAVSDAERLLFIVLLLVLFRSPLWLTSFLGNGRARSA